MSNIILNEIFDEEKLSIIIDNWDQLETIVGYGFDMKTRKKLNSVGTLTIFKKMLEKKKKTNEVVYSYSSRKNSGRMYSEYSLQGCRRNIRHTIARDFYYDIDIKNAHPTILLWYCNNNNIPCESIKYYIDNRDSCLNELMNIFSKTKDEIKETLLSIINGGDAKFDCSDAPSWLIDFYSQIQIIHTQITALNPKLLKEAKKKYGENYFNLKGSCINNIFCDYENTILQIMYQTCLANNIDVGVFVFDGMMINKENIHNLDELNDLLRKMEIAILNQLGMKVEIVNKPMDEYIDLSNFSKIEKEDEDDDDDDDDEEKEDEEDDRNKDKNDALFGGDDGLARIFYRHYAREFLNTIDAKGNGYYWCSSKLLWIPLKPIYIRNLMPSVIIPVLKRVLEECKSKNSKKFITELTRSIQKSSFRKGILESLLSLTKQEDFLTKLNISKFLLPITNGKIINLKTLEIRTRVPTDLFSYELDVDYTPNSPLTNARSFMNEISCNDHELDDFLVRLMGYFLTAETSDRSFYIFWGIGCNGKSTLFKIMKNILLQGYTGISKNVLIDNKSRSTLTPELEVLMYARLAVLSEIKENEKLDSSNIKSLTGQDVITCNPKNRDPIQFVPNCKMVMLCNDKPIFNIDDQAMIDRLKFIPFNARFEKTIENSAHCDFLTENKDCLSEFFTLFVQGANRWYNGCDLSPVNVMKDAMNQFVEEQDVIQQWVEECCEIGDNKRISGSDAWSSFISWNVENDGPKTSKQQFGKMLEKRFKKKKNNVIFYIGIELKVSLNQHYSESESETNNYRPPL